jgi:hypothetical protein
MNVCVIVPMIMGMGMNRVVGMILPMGVIMVVNLPLKLRLVFAATAYGTHHFTSRHLIRIASPRVSRIGQHPRTATPCASV